MASNTQKTDNKPHLPSVETIQREAGSAESIDDFFGREGIFARLFSKRAELTVHLGYEKHASEGRNSGNSRNGKRSKKLRTQTGDVDIQVPRDRNSEYPSPLLEQHAGREDHQPVQQREFDTNSSGYDARPVWDRRECGDHQHKHGQSLVEEWQNRPLERIYPIIYLDGVYVKLRQDGKVDNCAV